MSKATKTAAAFAAFLVVGGVAVADSPQFHDNQTREAINDDGELVVSFKETGLGTGNITYDLQADATTTCTCLTSSNRCPKAANKVTSTTHVDATKTVPTDRSGNVTTSITLEPPACPSSAPPTCGRGQHLELSAISYAHVSLEDKNNHIFLGGLTGVSDTFFECP